MAKHISSFNAKTHLSKLLSEVENGEKFIITKHRAPVAMLVPINQEKRPVENVIEDIKNLRKGILLKISGGIAKLKVEGRK